MGSDEHQAAREAQTDGWGVAYNSNADVTVHGISSDTITGW